MSVDLFLGNGLLLLGIMTTLWVYSVVRRDASVVDPWWSMLFLAVLVRSAWGMELGPGGWALLACVGLWSVRLWLHLLWRSRGHGEDPRYVAFRTRFGPERYWWISFFQVFLLQGALAWVISLPLQLAARAPAPDPLSVVDVVGLALFLAGFAFEAVGDAQLAAFRNDPARKGQVLDTGLWRYTRHPNYFGEALIWLGYGAFALDSPFGPWGLVGPALMIFLLLRVSGVTMLDEHLTRTRPGYADYVRRTSAFFPRPPKPSAPEAPPA